MSELVGLGAVCANNRKGIGPTIKSLITEKVFWYLFTILPQQSLLDFAEGPKTHRQWVGDEVQMGSHRAEGRAARKWQIRLSGAPLSLPLRFLKRHSAHAASLNWL